MAVEKIEHHLVDLIGVAHQKFVEPRRKTFGSPRPVGEKVDARFGERVVHDAVEFIASARARRRASSRR